MATQSMQGAREQDFQNSSSHQSLEQESFNLVNFLCQTSQSSCDLSSSSYKKLQWSHEAEALGAISKAQAGLV
jgi:hypothetical protein